MSYVDHLRERARIPNATYLKFITQFTDKSKDIYVFFEGNDDAPYYLPEVRRQYHTNFSGVIYSYKCNGKDNLNNVFKKVNARIKGKQIRRTLFIVDKDLDDILEIRPITKSNSYYITDNYSFENNLVNKQMIRSIWVDNLHLDDYDSRLLVYIEDFDLYMKNVNNIMSLIMSWVIFNRKNGNRPLLSNIKFEKIFKINNDFSITKKIKVLEQLNKAANIENNNKIWNDIKKIRIELRKIKEPKNYIRGKFELWFFVAYLKNIYKDTTSREKNRNEGTKRATPTTQINMSNIVELIAQSTPLPSSFPDFVKYNLSRI